MKKNSFTFLLLFLLLNAYAQDNSVTDQNGIESEISIAVNPNNPDQIIIASMGTDSPIIIYTSEDGGDNWNQSAFGEGLADPVLTYGDNNMAYLTYLDFGTTLEMSFAESADNGLSWDANTLTLDNKAADRQWIKRDNNPSSEYYKNIYLSYFHPENEPEIHIVKINEFGSPGINHPIHSISYDYVQNPAMDVMLDGTIVICFIAEDNTGNRKIVSVHSTDGSETFSNTEVIVADIQMFDATGNPVTDVVGFAPGDASRLGNSLQMAIDKSDGPQAGRVYLTWTDFVADNPDEGMNVYLSYSDDQGESWSVPQIVNDDAVQSSHQYYSGITVNSAGVLCLSWYDRRSDPVNDAVTDFYFTYSGDGGNSFFSAVKVNSESSNHEEVTQGLTTFGVGEYTSLASTLTHAYVVWSDGRENNGDMNVYFAKVALDEINQVEEIKMSPSLVINRVFPNPSISQELSLEFQTTQVIPISITIVNSLGTIVSRLEQSVVKVGVNLLKLETANLPAGSYTLELKQASNRAVKKILLLEN